MIRVDSDGKGFVLLDTPFQEIRGLRFDDKGQLYAAALNGRPGGGARRPEHAAGSTALTTGRAPVPSVSVSTEITAIAVVDATGSSSTSSSSSRDDRRSSKGAVYRIMPDGLWDVIWDSREDVPYDVVFDRTGAPIIATGNKGKLYRLEGEPLRPTLLTRASAQQVTAFYKDARGQLYFATANPGKLFRLSAERARARHLRVGAARRADAGDVGNAQLARHGAQRQQSRTRRHAAATPKRPTIPGAPGPPSRTVRRRAHRESRRRGICSGARS